MVEGVYRFAQAGFAMIPVVALLLNSPLSSRPCKRFFLYTAGSKYPQGKNPLPGRTIPCDMLMLTTDLNQHSPHPALPPSGCSENHLLLAFTSSILNCTVFAFRAPVRVIRAIVILCEHKSAPAAFHRSKSRVFSAFNTNKRLRSHPRHHSPAEP